MQQLEVNLYARIRDNLLIIEMDGYGIDFPDLSSDTVGRWQAKVESFT